MTGSSVLDVVIGLAFIYLLYSLFATTIQEFIATYMSFRSQILEIAIHRMLEDDNPSEGWAGGITSFLFGKVNSTSLLSNAFYQHPLIKFLGEENRKKKPSYITKETFSKVFIDLLRGENVEPGQDNATLIDGALKSGIIKWESTITVPRGLFKSTEEMIENSEPFKAIRSFSKQQKVQSSDIPALSDKQTKFLAKILIQPPNERENKGAINKAINNKDNSWKITIRIPPETLSFTKSIWADAQGDTDKFKTYLENWFDETMQRATGWYKKYTQIVLMVIGFAIAVIFNLNTMEIAAKLNRDPQLRAQLVQQADTFQKDHPNLSKEISQAMVSKNTGQADSLNELKARRDTLYNRADRIVNGDMAKANSALGAGIGSFKWPINTTIWQKLGYLIWCVFGWSITALAISLGAPFWFDLLNKLMKLRSSVANNSESTKASATEVTQRPNIDRKG
jgi:hypothetical protein